MRQEDKERLLDNYEDEWVNGLNDNDRFDFVANQNLLIKIWEKNNAYLINQLGDIIDILTEEQILSIAENWADTDWGKRAIKQSMFLRQKYAYAMMESENI